MQPSRDPRLVVVNAEPFNAETPLTEQVGVITPNAIHYVRSHFDIPARWERLIVDGAVERPLTIQFPDLVAMPRRSLVVTLECAGNGRAFLDPPAPGEPWRLGAVGTAEWTGVPLHHVLELARVEPRAVEIVFAGADTGEPNDVGHRIAYERSLPVDRALADEVLLAFAMNGELLPADHGAPLRLIVPRSYGMASVKWLARVTAVTDPFRGFYQADRYVIDGAPLPRVAPRAVITSPSDGARLPRRAFQVRGFCWSGSEPIDVVEVSVDGGNTWSAAALSSAVSPFAWRAWEWSYDRPTVGGVTLLARARTTDGGLQPLTAVRTSLGYANSQARPFRVQIE